MICYNLRDTLSDTLQVCRHSYTAEDSESDYAELKLVQPLDLNNLLAEKSIKFRFYMAQL